MKSKFLRIMISLMVIVSMVVSFTACSVDVDSLIDEDAINEFQSELDSWKDTIESDISDINESVSSELEEVKESVGEELEEVKESVESELSDVKESAESEISEALESIDIDIPGKDKDTEATTIEATEATEATAATEALLDKDGTYTSKDDVALYIYQYGELPSNFITKAEARKLGWDGGSVEDYAPGKCIGGDFFGNYEGLLPEKDGREYTECDIDTLGKSSRGAKRIIFSNDGLIYYTSDHYETFTLLYGEE